MRRFEYWVQSVLYDPESLEEVMNDLGFEGWELVSAYQSDDRVKLFFKRETTQARSDDPAALDMISEGGPASS